MYLHHKTITIRPAEPSDAPLLEHWWNDGTVMAHAGFPLGLGITAEEIAEDLTFCSDDTSRCLILSERDIPIGEMNYRFQDASTAEIGIKICVSSCQERGIGKIALSMLIHALFQRGCSRIILDTDLKNTRAQHVYETLGFRKLRLNRDSWTNQLGQLESSVDYELKPEDFHNFAV